MFLYIDESGNSGNNLFDQNQPTLSYGVLSSGWDVDMHAADEHRAMLSKVDALSLHANQLGEVGLDKIADDLVRLHERFGFNFDYYFIHKPSFAVVTFFNATFDAGINPAMKWDWYWTPLRFPLLAVLDSILDEELLRESWRLCLVPHGKIAQEASHITDLLAEVLRRLERADIPDRLAEILGDALRYGIENPLEMDFGIYSPTALSPNTIGFQFVLTAIAYRQKIHRKKALRITVDRQTQFNGAQVRTYEAQSKITAAFRGDGTERDQYLAHPFLADVREDTETLITHFPEERLTIKESDQSFGLQIADTYLWLINRMVRGQEVPSKLAPIIKAIFSQGMIDGISMAAMMRRWSSFEAKLPAFEDVTPEQRVAVQESIDKHRQRVGSLNLN